MIIILQIKYNINNIKKFSQLIKSINQNYYIDLIKKYL